MDAIENAGHLDYDDYVKCTLYTTLMGAEGLLECNCVEVVVLNDVRCRDLFLRFACNNPGVWEDELAKVGNTTEVKDGNNSD